MLPEVRWQFDEDPSLQELVARKKSIRGFWHHHGLKDYCSRETFYEIVQRRMSVKALADDTWETMAYLLGSSVPALQRDCLFRLYRSIRDTPLCMHLKNEHGLTFSKGSGALQSLLDDNPSHCKMFSSVLTGHLVLEPRIKFATRCVQTITSQYDSVTMDIAFPEEYHNRQAPPKTSYTREHTNVAEYQWESLESEYAEDLLAGKTWADVVAAVDCFLCEAADISDPDHRYRVILRRRLSGDSLANIAKTLKCTSENVRRHQAKAIKLFEEMHPAVGRVLREMLCNKVQQVAS